MQKQINEGKTILVLSSNTVLVLCSKQMTVLVFQVIDAISAAISATPGCSLLDVDPGPSTNRTVYTFVGSPEAVVEGALNAARQAFSLIDMSKHSGQQKHTCTCSFHTGGHV